MDAKTLSDLTATAEMIGFLVLFLCVLEFAEWLWRGVMILARGLCEWVAERAHRKGGHLR